MANRYADVSGIATGEVNEARDVVAALNALDGAARAIEDGTLFSYSVTSQQAGETLSVRDAVYLASDNKWYKIDTNDASPKMSHLRGIVTESGGIASGATGAVQVLGEVAGFTGLTRGEPVYASTTAGGFTQTKPTADAGGGQVALVQMGIALSARRVLLNRYVPQYMKREELADDATLTIVHHADAATRERRVRAMANEPIAGSSLTDYADTNQNEDVSLLERTVTYGSDQCSGGTPTANGYFSTYVPANAFDNDNITFWEVAHGGAATWIQYEFSTSKTIRKYTIRGFSGLDAFNPTAWELQRYDTGTSSWVTMDSVSGYSWSSGVNTFYVDIDGSSTKWRIYCTSYINGTWIALSEIEMMEASSYTDGNDRLAQSFQIDPGGTVGSVNLWLKKVGSPTGNLTVKIQEDSTGNPSGTAITNGTSETVAASTLSTSYGWITFTFVTAPTLTANTTYWLVLESTDSQSEENYVVWGADGSAPGYANGAMKSYASSTWSAESKDACFDVVEPDTEYQVEALVGRWAGAGDMGVRYDDGAGADTDTKTTFKNLSGETLDVTCVVEME